MNSSPIQKAVDLIGGQSALAKAIFGWHLLQGRKVKISQANIWAWLNVSKSPMPPAEHCRAIEEITAGAVTRYDLRPDVFGTNPSQQEAA